MAQPDQGVLIHSNLLSELSFPSAIFSRLQLLALVPEPDLNYMFPLPPAELNLVR
jgi:hypothetical protein